MNEKSFLCELKGVFFVCRLVGLNGRDSSVREGFAQASLRDAFARDLFCDRKRARRHDRTHQ
jgi:hypothetical protein